jgi:predicted glycosyltransferase
MRIMFNVAHPAHVHLFRNPVALLQRQGHEIEIVALEREVTEDLLKAFGLQYVTLGKSHPDLLVKSLDMVRRDFGMARLVKRFEPDVVVSTGIPYSVQASRVCGVPSIAFSDTEIATLVLKAMLPFVSAVCTPSCFDLDLGPKHIRYDGYHELAYLHPNYFTPNPSVVEQLNIEDSANYVLLRVSSSDSSHDLGSSSGLLDDLTGALNFIGWLEQFGKVLLTSELPLPKRLRKYEVKVQPHMIHDLISFASLYVGEGATMASEAGVLGIPWIFVSETTRGYLRDQEENYDLGRVVPDWKSARGIIGEWMKREDLESSWRAKREKLLREKIDVSSFVAEFIEDWPQSFLELSGGTP